MTAYYKQGFQPFFDNWKAVKNEPSVIPSLITYANKEFPGLLSKLSNEKAKSEFIQLLKLLVFAHRHAKNDDHLIDRLVEFTIVRDPMYKYSREAQKTFFSFATFSFLFAWFEASPQARQFQREKYAESQNPEHPERMLSEVAQLSDEAMQTLIISGQTINVNP